MTTPQDLADRLEKARQFEEALAAYPDTKPLAYFCVRNSEFFLASLRRSAPADTARADAIRECADIAKRHADVAVKNAAEVTNNIGRMAWAYRADESTFIQRDILALIDVVADEDGVDPSSYRYKTAAAYQIVGAIAKEFDVFEHPEVIRALDYLADHNHVDPLPWPASPLAPSRSAPASGEMGEAVVSSGEDKQ